MGIDVFLDWDESDRDPEVLGRRLGEATPEGSRLKMITNRGVKVFPDGLPETYYTDHWRCRITPIDERPLRNADVLVVLGAIDDAGLGLIKTEHLYTFDGRAGYSLGQGE